MAMGGSEHNNDTFGEGVGEGRGWDAENELSTINENQTETRKYCGVLFKLIFIALVERLRSPMGESMGVAF